MKRDGMVLMMTLILITLLMGLTALVLTQSQKLLRLGNDHFSKNSTLRIVNDLEQQLPHIFSGVNGAQELDLTMRLPLELENKNGDFTLKMECLSPYSRLNINRLIGPDGNINEPYMNMFMRIFKLYPIADTDLLMKLILDAIDTDTFERGNETEMAIASPDFKNGSIADMHQFYRILEYYIELTKDKSILTIPWENYIGFEGEKIDFNAVNAETLTLLLPNVSAEKIRSLTLFRTKAYETKEEAIAVEPQLGEIFDNYFFIYTKGSPYTLSCDIRLRERSDEKHLQLHYNFVDQKVNHVEFL